ncbi:protein S100-A1 [Betta splendens]|uniref:Protein S100 n=1 Tax=Betta splendens TaxID=158456 RepID=A0A6P7KN43_BETSP|nr:protein S100-A1 [Betta splendens]XP_055359282.1 protein S100-A1 [Betta splendens]
MSNLLELMAGLIQVFHSYSEKEGNKYTLTKGELKTMMQEQLGDELSQCNDPAEVDKVMKSLDLNEDGEVDFQEFMLVFALLTMACHEFFRDHKEGGKEGCKEGRKEGCKEQK